MACSASRKTPRQMRNLGRLVMASSFQAVDMGNSCTVRFTQHFFCVFAGLKAQMALGFMENTDCTVRSEFYLKTHAIHGRPTPSTCDLAQHAADMGYAKSCLQIVGHSSVLSSLPFYRRGKKRRRHTTHPLRINRR